MTMLETFVKPMHREGIRFVAIFAAITVVLFFLWEPLGWIGVILTIWCYYFFRDPKRATPLRVHPRRYCNTKPTVTTHRRRQRVEASTQPARSQALQRTAQYAILLPIHGRSICP